MLLRVRPKLATTLFKTKCIAFELKSSEGVDFIQMVCHIIFIILSYLICGLHLIREVYMHTLCILTVFALQVPGVLYPAEHMYLLDEKSITDKI